MNNAKKPLMRTNTLWAAWLLLGSTMIMAESGTPEAAGMWRSELYPETWTPPQSSVSFATDRIIQDFSYAGYRNGEAAIPKPTGSRFDVVDYGADPEGNEDSTAAIQAAIDAAALAGGGVVWLPAGRYRVSPQGDDAHSLRVSRSGIVIRGAGAGKTFLLNTSWEMRHKSVILVRPTTVTDGPAIPITSDLTGPTRRIPVADASGFSVGEVVRIEWQFTPGWIEEHGQQAWWNSEAHPRPARYLREITAVNVPEGWIEVNVPTRYTIRTRDHATVRTVQGLLGNVGVESFSMGNVEHPGTTWATGDYRVDSKPAFDVHSSALISLLEVRNSWVSAVRSFQPSGNSSTCHFLSNGIRLRSSFQVTLRDCSMERPQYGGGGGNGYMYQLFSVNECLLVDCVANFSRHGFSLSLAGTSGNVFLRCEDRETRRATGHDGNYLPNGEGSDNHMHFSHSNLWDSCHTHNSFWSAHHRGRSGTIPHGLSSAHAVFWNTSGSGTRYPVIILSEQARYGYVIGTSGEAHGARNPTEGNTAPADILEGIGKGASLEPQSLYSDQLQRRLHMADASTSTVHE